MSWVAIPDTFGDDPRLAILGLKAHKALIAMWCYSNRHETDGIVPLDHFAALFGNDTLSLLSRSKFISIEGDNISIPDFLEINVSHEKREHEREQGRKRKAEWKARQDAEKELRNAVRNGVPDSVPDAEKNAGRNGVPNAGRNDTIPEPKPEPYPYPIGTASAVRSVAGKGGESTSPKRTIPPDPRNGQNGISSERQRIPPDRTIPDQHDDEGAALEIDLGTAVALLEPPAQPQEKPLASASPVSTVLEVYRSRHTFRGVPLAQWKDGDLYVYYSRLCVVDRGVPPVAAHRPRDLSLLKTLLKEMPPEEAVDFLTNAVANWSAIQYKYRASAVPYPDMVILMKHRKELRQDVRAGGTVSDAQRVSRYQDPDSLWAT